MVLTSLLQVARTRRVVITWSQSAKRCTTTVIHHLARTLQLSSTIFNLSSTFFNSCGQSFFKTPRWARRAWHCGTKAPECGRGVPVLSDPEYISMQLCPTCEMERMPYVRQDPWWWYCIGSCKFIISMPNSAVCLRFRFQLRRVDIRELPTPTEPAEPAPRLQVVLRIPGHLSLQSRCAAMPDSEISNFWRRQREHAGENYSSEIPKEMDFESTSFCEQWTVQVTLNMFTLRMYNDNA